MSHDTEEARRSIGAKRNPASADAILDAAEAVLIENGHAGFSIEAVARRARAGKPTIYRWWPSKAALLLDVYQRQKRFAYPNSGNIEEDLFLFLKGLFSQWRETPSGSIFRSIVAEAQSDEAAASALFAYSAERRAQTAKLIKRAQERGEVLAAVDAELVADLISSYAWTYLLTDRLDEDDATLRATVAIILRGIGA